MKPEDRAQELELNEWEQRQKNAIQPAATKPSAKWCVGRGCGERIPEARRKAMPGVQLCIGCQELNEKHRGRYASAN
jgi:phage/conjugal plasmid C-4 type zinc finger TraR family protein